MTSSSVGKKCREVISAKRYWYQRTAADEGEDRLVHEGGGGGAPLHLASLKQGLQHCLAL